MAKKSEVFIGAVFGRLTVVSDLQCSGVEPDTALYRLYVTCSCSCGGIKKFLYANLGRATNSCGCLVKERQTIFRHSLEGC